MKVKQYCPSGNKTSPIDTPAISKSSVVNVVSLPTVELTVTVKSSYTVAVVKFSIDNTAVATSEVAGLGVPHPV